MASVAPNLVETETKLIRNWGIRCAQTLRPQSWPTKPKLVKPPPES